MTTTILRSADRVATPWKNGGGITREIAVWPPRAGLDDFDWRISMAEVQDAGAFSRFAEVDRCLTVIEGSLRLTIDDQTSVVLNARSEPRTFPGDRPCHGQPIGGPVLDLNVMSRRGLYHSEVKRVSSTTWRSTSTVALLIALGPLTVLDEIAPHHAIDLEPLDGLLLHAPSIETPLSINGPALTIDIRVCQGASPDLTPRGTAISG